MASDLVIKVRYGDTVRRFNTYVAVNGKLDLSMVQLREKIRSFFSFDVNEDFTVTYVDTDGDKVTLVEDCDLDDVVSQQLNPVRMLVTVKAGDKEGSLSGRSRSSDTDLESARVQQTIENIHADLEEAVKTVPEPLRGMLLKLTMDFAASLSAPVIADFVHSVSKIGESLGCQAQDPQIFAQKASNVQNKDVESENCSAFSSSKSNIDAETGEKKLSEKLRRVRPKGSKGKDIRVRRVPDLNIALSPPSGFASNMAAYDAYSSNTGEGDRRSSSILSNGQSSNFDVNLFNECPFSGTQVDTMFQTSYNENTSFDYKQRHRQFENMGAMFHKGVICDECGANPITGPRFKSKVKYNYDLCSTCYQKSGTEAEYVRIDYPSMHRRWKALHHEHGGHVHLGQTHGSKPIVKLGSSFVLDVNVIDGTVMAPSVRFTKIWRMRNTGNVPWPMGTQLVWIDGDKMSKAVSVNLEVLVFQFSFAIVKFIDMIIIIEIFLSDSFQIPAAGVPVYCELDVAVDFIAPECPGEYVSYWRMASPTGRLFGQMVWVFIQVGASYDPLSSGFSQLDLNLPPQSKGREDPIGTDINVEPSMNSPHGSSNSIPVEAATSEVTDQESNTVTQAVDESVDVVVVQDLNLVSKVTIPETRESATNEQNLNFPTNDTSLIGETFPNTPYPPVISSVSSPILGGSSSMTEVAALPNHATEELSHKDLSEEDLSQAEDILKKMGYDFKQADEIQLCILHGWDQKLDELEKMGFSDKMKNSKLLLRYNGSIKNAVMELVTGKKVTPFAAANKA